MFECRGQMTAFALPAPPLADEPAAAMGEVFTRRWVVEMILDLVGYTPDRDLAALRAIEPACGAGAFVVPMVERLVESCSRHGRSVGTASAAIRAFDLRPENVVATREAVRAVLRRHGVRAATARTLPERWVDQADFLLRDRDTADADVVVGNPPYVRLEDVPAARADAYRSACGTMRGRADVFVGFFEVGLRSLKAGGRLGFVCADRWMRNSYGRALRGLISAEYAVDAVVSMHDVDAFEERVSAYPAVTVLRAGEQGRALIADTTSAFGPRAAAGLVRWAGRSREPLSLPGVRAAWLPHWFGTDVGWPAGSPERLALIAGLEDRFPPLEDAATGTKVGIGLATGADSVYITRDSTLVENERLLPMAMRQDIRTGRLDWSGHFLVNPWTDDGLVRLGDWPRLKRHCEAHRTQLAGRNVGRRNPGREHRTIDRVIPGLRRTPKLLFPDMSQRIWPVLDEGHLYPHHNLYWVTSEGWDLRVLGGLLLSDVAELFVSTYCVRMRGGTLRFQAQYLRRIRVPRPADVPAEDALLLAGAFERRDVGAATAVARRLYGVAAIPD